MSDSSVSDMGLAAAGPGRPIEGDGTVVADLRLVNDADQVNILIVDDEPRNLTVLETILDSPHYRLVRAESAEQALLALLSDEFAVLILDINMPGTTGFQLANLIKGRKKTSQIPIIFLTAYFNDEQHIVEGYESGAVDYLHKPVNPGIMRSKVAVLAELHRKQRELENANRRLLVEINDRRAIQEQLHDLNETLEQRVLDRTEELRESSVLLKAVADNASVGLAIVDNSRRYKFANPAYCQLHGVTESIVGRMPSECMPREYLDQIDPHLDRALSGERVMFELVLSAVDADVSRTKHYSVVYEPDKGGKGTIVAVVIVVIDITAHKQTEQHIQLLMNEVNHRSKNLLSVVMAVARHTSGSNPQEFTKRFANRLQSLAVNHDLLVKNQWKSIDVYDLVSGQLAHLGNFAEQRILLDGPRLQLSPSAAEAIGMVVHELQTNAVKHGALSTPTGSVEVFWSVDSNGDASDEFRMRWVEKGGPKVVTPSSSGFGTTIITQVTEMKLDGKVQLDYAVTGLSWSLKCRISSIMDPKWLDA